MGNPLVSVIMNCLNCEKYLDEAIASVYAQTYPNWEIIFWDNCSTDSSGKIAQQYDHRLRYFRGEETILLGQARNRAIEQARGEFIAFLDCDDLWLPDKLAKQLPLFDDPEVGLVFSDAVYFNNAGDERRRYNQAPYWTGRCFSQLLENYFLVMPTLLVRKRTLQSLDEWFDPQFDFIEEADLARRIGHAWKLAMVDEPLAKWRMHMSSSTYRNYHLVTEETMRMLDKYRALFPGFEDQYRREIKNIKQKLFTDEAIHHLLNGKQQAARKSLRDFRFESLKTLLLYGMTFLGRRPTALLLAIAKKVKGTMLPVRS